jgi:1,2-diacylglycerol 3-alpha-glucosyltransferase
MRSAPPAWRTPIEPLARLSRMKTIMKLAISFTNFGPYHLARLRALASVMAACGDRLLAYETASREERYPWRASGGIEAFDWVTLFPGRALEAVPRARCARAMSEALERDRPDALAIVGYVRPESLVALAWGRRHGRPTILLSESHALDRPRVWWKEAIKGQRVQRFSSALVGGARHRDYLIGLGMPPEQIVLGYNAVDNAWFAHQAASIRRDPSARQGLPEAPYFLAVNRFVAEKNLPRLVRAFAAYRQAPSERPKWDLVLCGDGPGAGDVESAVQSSGCAHAIHRPGFLQADDLVRWYAFASAFVHASLSEPWGLVVNEASSCGLPLLVSERAGCVDTLVPDPPGTTGRRFNPEDEAELAAGLAWLADMSATDRAAMGQRATALVSEWGPDRFAHGTLEALALAFDAERARRRTRRQALTSSSKEERR